MRLGVAGLRGIPGVMGGVEAHVQELYPRVAKARPALEVEVAMRRPYVERVAREWNGLRLWPIWATRNKFLETITHTLIALFFLRFRRRCGAVHLHAIGPGLLVPLARLLGLRVLFTHHGRDYDRAKWNRPAKAVLQFGEWLSVRFSDQVIVVSERLADALRQRFPTRAERISFVPNGASLTFVNASRIPDPVLLASLGIAAGQYILGVGRLVPEKGFDDLIAAHLSSGDPRKLVIAGKADHADAYAKALLAKAGERVVFAGFQPHEALRSLYAGASLFVLPSHHEGLPIAALEALAMDTPTLLSDIEPNAELALTADHYFPTGDIDTLAACLNAPEERFAVDGSALRERYDWDKIAARTAAIIDRLQP
ncbi:Glycosyltransferase involved in cell wall bisynthesis [Sphingomonas gellani]|uniref:Glycosyltransferase involved in cell wall bisynthesis n=1 Tax=Sphingomonas gellani TaxID=1166340 RepID=A0A1H8HX18_9SPHN|nr:glycosyltransferase family 4 protein [Sphingomonas gellani]SEN60581.1 Glycosyltransferase involved in cell wall bisynthesis [Sphingomonas gellani]